MNIKKITAVSVLATIALTTLGTTAAEAALPKCNAARKGRIVGQQVCAIKNGGYRWVEIVKTAPTPSAAPLPSPSAIVIRGFEVPVGWTKREVAGKISFYAPSHWVEKDAGLWTEFLPEYGSLGLVSARISVVSTNINYQTPDERLAEMEKNVAPEDQIVNAEVRVWNGLRIATIDTLNKTLGVRTVEFFNGVTDKSTVQFRALFQNGTKGAVHKAEIESIMKTIEVYRTNV